MNNNDVLGGLFRAFQDILLRVVLIIVVVGLVCLAVGYAISSCILRGHP
jgi:hypothetical protein